MRIRAEARAEEPALPPLRPQQERRRRPLRARERAGAHRHGPRRYRPAPPGARLLLLILRGARRSASMVPPFFLRGVHLRAPWG